jgi:uncharacterized protein (DUF433 family)
MTQATAHRCIVTDDQILSGEPINKGMRTPVRAVVEQSRQGTAPDSRTVSLHARHHLHMWFHRL